MKYKITSKKIITKSNVAIAPLRTLTPCSVRSEQEKERILFSALFEFSALPEAKAPPRQPRKNILTLTLKKIRSAVKSAAQRSQARQKRPTSFYAYALIAVSGTGAAIALITALVFFGRAIIPYSTVTIPSFAGLDADGLESAGDYEIIVSYEYHDDVAAGKVISQFPPACAQRKLYFWSSAPEVFLTVSAGKHFYTIPDLTGKDGRDALLELKNLSIPVRVVTEYSELVSTGEVIATIPPPDQRLYDGDILTLRISLGAMARSSYVPSLLGMSESAAAEAISSAGLTLGKISYQNSDFPAGKVISQQYTPFSRVAEGTGVDIVVSLGNPHTQKYVPELYGATLEEAERKLRQVGLVIGNIYSVTSGVPAGTVISQSPIPSTPITSNINSVDIYVSS